MRLHTVQFGGIKICHADLWRAVFTVDGVTVTTRVDRHARHDGGSGRANLCSARRLMSGASTFGKQQNRKLKVAPFPHKQPMTPSLIGHGMLAPGSKPWLQLVSTRSSFCVAINLHVSCRVVTFCTVQVNTLGSHSPTTVVFFPLHCIFILKTTNHEKKIELRREQKSAEQTRICLIF